MLVAGLGGLLTVVNLAFAQTWTPTGAPSQAWTFVAGRATWASIASSADGIKLVAVATFDASGNHGHIYTSVDSGAS